MKSLASVLPRLTIGVLLTQASCKTRPSDEPHDLKVTNGEAIEAEAEPAIVMLLMDGDALCTGTFVNDYQVVTAAHCVKHRREARIVEQRFLSAILGYRTIAICERLEAHPRYASPSDNEHDLGVIDFPRGSARETLELASTPAAQGDRITIIGYGNDVIESQMVFGEMQQSGAAQKRTGHNTIDHIEDGKISFRGHLSADEAASAGNQPGERAGSAGGDSGGPVLDAAGKVIGVVSAGRPKYSGFDTISALESIAVDVTSESARNFLSKQLEPKGPTPGQ